jgi:hypothetical protein
MAAPSPDMRRLLVHWSTITPVSGKAVSQDLARRIDASKVRGEESKPKQAMKMLWCWRCKTEVPMLDDDEFKRVSSLLNTGTLGTECLVPF